jgi:hypothetical protein
VSLIHNPMHGYIAEACDCGQKVEAIVEAAREQANWTREYVETALVAAIRADLSHVTEALAGMVCAEHYPYTKPTKGKSSWAGIEALVSVGTMRWTDETRERAVFLTRSKEE